MKGKKDQLSLWPLPHMRHHPLEGPRLKIRRAKGELKRLWGIQTSIRRESNYQAVRAEMDLKRGEQVYRVKSDGPHLPLEVGADIGDIAHALRSALDLLVNQLVGFAGEAPTRRTQFPICLTRKGTVRKPSFLDVGIDRLKGVLPEHQAIIEALQPYKRGRRGKSDALWMLQQIDNTDKHKLIAAVTVGIVAARTCDLREVARVPRGEHAICSVKLRHNFLVLKDGAKVAQFPRHMYVYPNLIPFILFGDGSPDEVIGQPVLIVLDAIVRRVSEAVEAFAGEFPL